jgi:quercetin dioxygenase-like cupin family protein
MIAMCVFCVAVTALSLAGSPPPATLVADAPPRVSVAHVLRDAQTVVGQPLAYLNTARPEVVSVVQTYPPGAATGWHKHLTASHIYVLEGRLTLDIDGAPSREFGPGEAYLESVEVWHNARNASDAPLRLLVVTFGEAGTGNTVFRDAAPR